LVFGYFFSAPPRSLRENIFLEFFAASNFSDYGKNRYKSI
jgi:hypothetical protein